MTLLKKAFTGILWNSAGKMLEYILLYLVSILVARGLGLFQNGTYATLISVAQMILVLSSMGLEAALNKTIPQFDGPEAPSRIRFLLLRAAGVRVSVFLLATALLLLAVKVFRLYSAESLTEYLVLLFVYAAIRSLTTLVTTSLTALFRTDIVSIVGVAMRAIELSVIAALSARGLSIPNLLALFSVTGACQIVLSLSLLRRSLIGDMAPHSLRPFFAFGAIYWINSIVDYFLGRHGDVLFLAGLTSDPSQASMYDVSFSLTHLAGLALTIGFGGVTFATFARLALGPASAVDEFYGFLLRLISFLAVPLYAFLAFNARPVVSLFYSPAFSGAVALVQGMVFFKIASRLFGGGENTEYLLARGRVGWVSSAGVAAAGVNIALDVILIPTYGAFGAVMGSGFANLFVNATTRVLVGRYSRVPLQLTSWSKIAASALLMSWVVAMLFVPEEPVSLLGRLCVFTIGIIVLAAILKPFSAEDVRLLSEVSPQLAGRVRFLAVR
jgi:O-antigen/teichoic acid export membrane protein